MSATETPVHVLYVGETLPAACDAHDLMRVFGKSLATIYRWHKDGKLRRFEVKGRPVGDRRWSGRLLQEHANGGASLGIVTAEDQKRGAA